MMMMPLLAIIGSQIIFVIFSKRMAVKAKQFEQYKIKQREAVRAKRREGMDAEPRARQKPSNNPLRR